MDFRGMTDEDLLSLDEGSDSYFTELERRNLVDKYRESKGMDESDYGTQRYGVEKPTVTKHGQMTPKAMQLYREMVMDGMSKEDARRMAIEMAGK